ncbi:unnamed protein product, partial [Phaeothamnion confervicola]
PPGARPAVRPGVDGAVVEFAQEAVARQRPLRLGDPRRHPRRHCRHHCRRRSRRHGLRGAQGAGRHDPGGNPQHDCGEGPAVAARRPAASLTRFDWQPAGSPCDGPPVAVTARCR